MLIALRDSKLRFPRVTATRFTPSLEQTERLKHSDATIDWLSKLPPEELRQYCGQWIAAYDCRIVASGNTRDDVEDAIRHLDRSLVIVHRVEDRWMVR